MFEFEWGSPSQIFLSPVAGDPDAGDSSNHDGVHSYSAGQADVAGGFVPPAFLPFYGVQQTNNDYRHIETVSDPRAFSGASYLPASQTGSALASSGFDSAAGFMMFPKPEPGGPVLEAGRNNSVDRIGLNLGLGNRTYFSAGDDNFLSRLYRRSRPFDGGLGGSMVANSPKCQAEGCNADLSNAKHYHRRHKVCEFHSKASTVVAGGLTQRFCQQCSRFHLLTEFDNGKRSCRRRLADHNRRRRKSHQATASQDRRPSQPEKPGHSSCSENAARSPSDSGTSMSAAASPARISLDSLRSMQESSVFH